MINVVLVYAVCINVFLKVCEGKKCKVISTLYKGLWSCRKTSSLYIKEKWEKELKENITEEEWFVIYKTQCTATSSRSWREFNWKNTNVRKETVGNQQPCWRLWTHECGPYAYFLVLPKDNRILGQNMAGLIKIIGYKIPKSCKILYLGNMTQDMIQKQDEYLIKVLLSPSKKAITRLWYKAEPPTVEQWVSTVEEIFVMEKITHKLRLQETQFLEKWTDYRTQKEDTTNTTGQ